MTATVETPASTTATNVAYGLSYARISDDDDGSRAGVERQARRNEELAERRGIELAERFVDNSKSASKNLDARDDYRAMMVRIEQGDIRYVLAWHPDRLLRSVEEGEQFIKTCREYNVLVVTATASDFDLSTSHGRKTFRQTINDASYESEHRGERVAEARQDQASKGRYGGGVRPYGWGKITDQLQRVYNKETREWEMQPYVDMNQHREDEAQEIRRWRDMVYAGVSLKAIVRDCHDRRVPTQAETDGRTVQRHGKTSDRYTWNARVIKAILTSPRVAGHAVYKGEIVMREAWEPIISEDDWKAMTTILTNPARAKTTTKEPKWLGSLIIRCGLCDDDSTMSVRYVSVRNVPAYRCRSCGKNTIHAVQLDQYLTNLMITYIGDHLMDLINDADNSADLDALRRERKALVERRNQLSAAFAQGAIDMEQLTVGTSGINSQVDGIDQQLSAAAGTSPLAPMAGGDDVSQVWHAMTLAERREIVRTLVRVTVHGPGSSKDIDYDRLDIEWLN